MFYSFLPGPSVWALLRLCWLGLFHFWAVGFSLISPYSSFNSQNLANSSTALVEVKNKGGNLSLQVSGLLTLCLSSSPSGLTFAAPCLACYVCAVVGAGFSRHCSALRRKLVYDCLFVCVCRREDSPVIWSMEVCPALDVSRDLLKSVGCLWLSHGCSVVQRGTSPIWSWEPCVLRSAHAGLCDLGQATTPLWAWVPSL